MLRSFLCAILLLTTLPAAPQQCGEFTEDPNLTLTGDGQRVWVYGGYGSFSAGERGGVCTGSDTWIFSSSGSLTQRMCREKRLITRENISWKVRAEGRCLKIKIDGTDYDLHLGEYQTKGREMILVLNAKSNYYYYKP